jgi:hypothetical protein
VTIFLSRAPSHYVSVVNLMTRSLTARLSYLSSTVPPHIHRHRNSRVDFHPPTNLLKLSKWSPLSLSLPSNNPKTLTPPLRSATTLDGKWSSLTVVATTSDNNRSVLRHHPCHHLPVCAPWSPSLRPQPQLLSFYRANPHRRLSEIKLGCVTVVKYTICPQMLALVDF